MAMQEKVERAKRLSAELGVLHDEILQEFASEFHKRYFAPNDIIEYKGQRMKIDRLLFRIANSEPEIRKVYAFKFKKNGEPYSSSTELYIWSLSDLSQCVLIERANPTN